MVQGKAQNGSAQMWRNGSILALLGISYIDIDRRGVLGRKEHWVLDFGFRDVTAMSPSAAICRDPMTHWS